MNEISAEQIDANFKADVVPFKEMRGSLLPFLLGVMAVVVILAFWPLAWANFQNWMQG